MLLKIYGPSFNSLTCKPLAPRSAIAASRCLSTLVFKGINSLSLQDPSTIKPTITYKSSNDFRKTSSRIYTTTTSNKPKMSSDEYKIDKLTAADFDEWSALFHAYIDFYQSKIPEEQYRKTFERILDDKSDLYALVMRENQEAGGRMVGIAHFFPEQTPWSEKKIMLFNDLFIDPSLRGKGAGRRMINAVADVARDTDCLRVQWLTKHDNTTARRLYDTLADCSFVQYRMKIDA